MTAAARPDADVITLRITRRPAIDTEGPYIDDADTWPRGAIDGSLALALPLGPPAPAPYRLHLVDAGHTADLRPDAAQARLWEDDVPVRPTPVEPPAAEPTPEVRVVFDPVRTPRPQLPPPGPTAATLARAVLEVLAGDRSLRQLSRLTSAQVYDDLEVLVSPCSSRPWAGSLRRILLCEPAPGVAEVTAVVAQEARTVAMALRMEGMDGRWQLTALQLG